MSKSFGEYATTREFEDAIRQMVRSEILNNRPACRYAVVQQINPATRSCYVTFNGDVTMSKVPYRSIVPAAPGQVVAVEGTGSDQYIADVLGVNQADVNIASLAALVPWNLLPTLGTGISNTHTDKANYRVVEQFGVRWVQLKGRLEISGSRTLLWTMPAGIRPAVNLAPMLIARNPVGGSNVAQLEPQSNGQMIMSLASQTAGVDGTATANNSTQLWSEFVEIKRGTSTHNGEHKHPTSDGPPPSTGTWTGFMLSNRDHSHTYDASHSHRIDAHSHPLPSVSAPTWVSLNSVQYPL